jgi:hypothetical protein
MWFTRDCSGSAYLVLANSLSRPFFFWTWFARFWASGCSTKWRHDIFMKKICNKAALRELRLVHGPHASCPWNHYLKSCRDLGEQVGRDHNPLVHHSAPTRGETPWLVLTQHSDHSDHSGKQSHSLADCQKHPKCFPACDHISRTAWHAHVTWRRMTIIVWCRIER